MATILSFDIGYASIGWCALSSDKETKKDPEFLGTGVVTFPTDDCLASQRRALRRTRRHIRSTRLRIERMKKWLVHRGVLSREDLDRPGHPAPFLLAAASLQGKRTLTAWELWTVLRWYAHNRGYDGNSLWSRGDEDAEDTEKVTNAMALMEAHKTKTMCETVCGCLGLDPAQSDKRISSTLPYKTLNAAYPRRTITAEVSQLLKPYVGKLPGMDATTVRLLLTNEELSKDARNEILAAGIKLPKRFFGGLLFGQLVPRFDNRIIARCPITWAKTFDDALQSGKSEAEARHLADKYGKVPSAKCPEFFRFRFAMLLANLKIDDGSPLPLPVRKTIWQLAEDQGRVTHKDLNALIKQAGHKPYNLDAYFKVHPDSEEALTLDPVKEFPNKNQIVKAIWPSLAESVRDEITARWKKGGSITLAEMFRMSGESPAVKAAIDAIFDKDQKAKSKRAYKTIQDLLDRKLSPAATSGRASYARPVLKAVVDEVLGGPWHPLKANKATDPENGEDKPANGVLYDLGIPTSRVRQLQDARPIEQLTNNHLVRHRMLILERLLDDLLAEFLTKEKSVDRVIVEVARELREFSGKNAQEIKKELNSRLKDFKAAVAYLEKNAPKLETNGGIIRKCRIAMDLEWRCPFTGEKFDAYDLPKLEREHIIPYATRNTNALHALVLTWPEVNKMKGKRTARQFIAENEGKQVDGKPNLSLFTLRRYDEFVDKLKISGHDDDRRRQKARKALLATTDFEDKELGFTEGQLTQSSHLMKLAMGALKRKLPAAAVDPIPGPVTSEIRKAWKLMGTLSRACPEILDSDGNVLPKDDIRSITHLHHALDAATLALAAHYFPMRSRGQDQKGKIWQAMLKRNRTESEIQFLLSTGCYKSCVRTDRDGKQRKDVCLQDLSPALKNSLAVSLADCRVMQHIPADRSGARLELTTWGIVKVIGESVLIIQRPNRGQLELEKDTTQRRWKDKPASKEAIKLLKEYGHLLDSKERRLVERGIYKLTTEKISRLLGPASQENGGKLAAIKGALVIGDNFAIALDPAPALIPFHNVHDILAALTNQNRGKLPRLIRIGTIIKVPKGTWKGTWRVLSVKNSEAYGISLDLAATHCLKLAKGNAKVPQMVADGLEILPRRYTGHPVMD